MSFDKRLWDGSDPLYAPCISWTKGHAYWKCPARYVKAGYRVKSLNLRLPGTLEDEYQADRAMLCRKYTQELERWWKGLDEPQQQPGTWKWLIAKYLHDEFSPIHDVKAGTRASYRDHLKPVERVIGDARIEVLTFETIRKIERAMRDKGRTDAFIHRFFSSVRRVAAYGAALKIAEAREVKAVLSEMRFRQAPARSVAPTRGQVRLMVDAADAEGSFDFACGIMTQFELSLRAADVRGLWEPDEGQGGIRWNGKVWMDGLTCEMFERDLSGFTKVISKTAKSLPEPLFFDLTNLPELRTRFRMLGVQHRTGPVIRSPRAQDRPYTKDGWSQAWKRLRRRVGLPEEVKMMDTRAGAITEAASLGADPYAVRDAAQHKNITTTDRYSRQRSENVAKVIQLRTER